MSYEGLSLRWIFCDQCIHGCFLDVLKHVFRKLMQRASSLFPSGEPLRDVTVEFRFALAT